MKFLLLIFSIGMIIVSCNSDKMKNDTIPTISSNDYDSILAKKYGADGYGMKQYVMAFLKVGPNRDQDSSSVEKIQRAHLDNIQRLAKEGKLVVAGPFMDDFEVKGIYIFNVSSLEEAKKLTETDPAIKSGRLIMDLHPWYGPAGLMQLDSIQKKISKKII